MKTFTIFLLMTLLGSVHAQEWTSYTNHKEVLDIEKEGNTLWVATNGGLLKWNLVTETYTKISTNQGLISNYIYDITIDAEGKKWLATSRGVSVLDENEVITNYTKADGLFTNIVTAVLIDELDNKWFSCFDVSSAVSKLDHAGNWSIIEESKSKKITTLALDSSGSVIMGGNLLYRYSSDGIWSQVNNGFGTLNIRGIALDANQDIWASTYYSIYHFDADGNYESYDGSDGLLGDPKKLSFDAEGNLWIQTTHGISKKNLDHSFINYPLNVRANSILVEDEIVYVGSSDDVLKLENDVWSSYHTTVKLPANNITAIEIANNGDIFMGTGLGLTKLNTDGNWSSFDKDEGLVCQLVNSLVATSWGELVITHSQGCSGTSFFNIADETITTVETDTFAWIMSAAEDSESNLWLGYYSHPIMDWLGTTKIDPDGNKTPYKFTDVHPTTFNNKTTGMALHPNGDMYFSTRDGLYYIGTEGELHLFHLGHATSIFVDSKEDVWIGEGDYGSSQLHSLEKYTAAGENVKFNNAEINTHNIYNFAEDNDNNVWMASENGLFKINTEDEITRYTTADGIADNHVTDIAFDENGKMWISTLNGISTTASISTSSENIVHKEKTFSIYPNPSSGTFQFAINGVVHSSARITVYNNIGQRVYLNKNESLETLNTLDLEHLVNGVYFILVEIEGDTFQQKVIIQR